MPVKAVDRAPYGVDVKFLLCKGLPDVEAVKRVARLLAERGFRPASVGGDRKFYARSDTDALVNVAVIDMRSPCGGQALPGFGLTCGVFFPVLVDGFAPDAAYCAFGWKAFEDESVMLTLAASVLAPPDEQAAYHEPFAQRFRELAAQLYALARPAFGSLSNPEVDPDPSPCKATVKKRRFATLNWVNLFGPEYVARYGREMLAGIPGSLTEDLPDGGLLYQSRPSIMVADKAAHERWQREATQYLLARGVRLRWRDIIRF